MNNSTYFINQSLSKKGRKKILLLIFICIYINTILAQTIEPILRLNTSMHTNRVDRISIDAFGKYLLTTSCDKTAKFWDAATGELLQTFRVPIDKGNEGMLYAGALSPDGNIAVVGGYSSFDETNFSIYVFNTKTGKLIQQIPKFENIISDLEFSTEGGYLAVATNRNVVVFKNINNKLETYKKLKIYTAACNNIAFDKSGNLATVCYDGKIRLYNEQFNLIKESNGSGKKPYSISFSSNGKKIAVGYGDIAGIDVLSSSNLQLLYHPNITGMTSDDTYNIVSFSNIGEYLYSGSSYRKNDTNGRWLTVIRQWANEGNGTYKDFFASEGSIFDIKPLPNEDIFFAGSEPDFGRLNSNGKIKIYIKAETNDYNAKDDSHLKINTFGNRISFKPLGKENLLFNATNKSLAVGNAYTDMLPSVDSRGSIKITDWDVLNQPKINGKPTSFLIKNENCYSVDINNDAGKIVFGASWNIYCIDANGNKIWRKSTQASAMAVNISDNGKCLVAAMDDGTIDWYNMEDGSLLLTLFAHPDNKRWVLWTPEGYYDCSIGAEDLIGWHLNNGADKEAYFFPTSKFRNQFYRPDIIENVLVTYDTKEAIRIANELINRTNTQPSVQQILPPVVRIVKPFSNSEISNSTFTLTYTAVSPNKETITDVKILVDGRPIECKKSTLKPVTSTLHQYEIVVTIPQKDVTVSILAQNVNGWSEPASINLKWKGTTEQDILKPTLYVLAVGISNYRQEDLKLNLAAKDAKDFVATMKAQKGGLYKDVQVLLLPDEEATRYNIIKGLKWLKTQATSRDVAMIFISGHGANDNTGTFYFLPVDADTKELEASCLLYAEIKNTVSVIPGKIIVFIDACHSGNIMGSRKAVDINGMVNELAAAENGAVIFTSSTGKQYSLENPEWNNGAFTKALIEGISGKADIFKTGKITIKTLDAYIADRVKYLTSGKQSPTTIVPISMPDFGIAIISE